jgi:HK97 family phage major capsid protein
MQSELIDQLKTARDRARTQAEQICVRAEESGRTELSELEARAFDTHKADMQALNARIADETENLNRSQIPAALRGITQTQGRTAMTSVYESRTYQQGDTRRSYLVDLARATLNRDEDGECRKRLMNHAQDVAEGAEYRDISRVDGAGGYAVPPAWLVNQFVEFARAGRAFANVVQRQPLPGGTDQISIPKLLTGTAVGVQTADNAAVLQTDLTDTFISAPVRTISGQQGVALQLIDQSPIAFDDVVFRDLVAAHAAVLDQQVIYGSGANGQVLGVANTPNITSIAVAYLDIIGIYKAIANAIQQIHVGRFLPPECIVLHPRRWGWLLTLLDTNNRPLFQPSDQSAYNAAGILTDVDSQQIVGRTHGLPIITDPNITVTAGAGTNEDQIYVMRSSDLVLFESGLRARVLPETKAANLTVLLQVYSYFAFTAARYPQSVVQLTGLPTPVF